MASSPQFLILVINPGSTSTKLALFSNETELWQTKLDHAADNEFQKKFAAENDIFSQFSYRLDLILGLLKEKKVTRLDAVVGRGGMMPPVTSGTYLVTAKMIDDLKNHPLAQHASNLGAPLAAKIARHYRLSGHAFIVDPVTTDEMAEKHKITGVPGIKRYAAWHALNQKAVGRQYAADHHQDYQKLNLIIAHLGGGFSFGAHRQGRAINVYNALSGEGPFTPERAGALPAQNLIEMCFAGQQTKEELLRLVAGGGGLFALLGTKDLKKIEDDFPQMSPSQKDIVDEMIAGISRSICSLIPDFEGEKIDQIILTGGAVRWPVLVEKIKQDLFALNIGLSLYPGEKELEALRDGALRILRQTEKAKKY